MSSRFAVLLDTVSIQDFIFRSNELRENLGASCLIEEVYSEFLVHGLTKVTNINLEDEQRNLNLWEDLDSSKYDISKRFNYGYIGGGNALLFFENEKYASEFIKEWTKILLINVPGLTTAVALEVFSEDEPEFRKKLDDLFEKLKKNKNEHIPITLLPRHGITTECHSSGESAEVYNLRSKAYVSAGTNARIEAAKRSKEEQKKKYKALFGKEQYCFTNELDQLGGISGEDSHIAIVHIDGNDVGERFKKAKSLNDIEKLSKLMKKTTEKAFEEVIRVTIKNYDNIMLSLGFDPESKDPQRQYPKNKNNEKILPIRLIILGGDDVTFVCDGKLGIFFAKIFIEAYEKSKGVHNEKLTACAGVAIIKTKYPFYRGVSLANELCGNAKKVRKDPDKGDLNSSYLDFQISLGGVIGGLHKIRDTYDVPQGNLLYRPFKITSKELFDENSLDVFLEMTWRLKFKINGESHFPNNKINELNEVLTLTEEAARKFVQHEKLRKRELPEIQGHHYGETLFENGLTPYHDIIEILHFYPDLILKDEYGENHE